MLQPNTDTTAPNEPGGGVDALTNELRTTYTNTYNAAYKAAVEARDRFATPDGNTNIDPAYAADTAACRAINTTLTATVNRHLPGARLITRIDEPAVIDSQWLHQRRVIVIEWDHHHDFGDPQALTVTEVNP